MGMTVLEYLKGKSVKDAMAAEALRALHAEGYETENSYCQRFVKQVTRKVLGAILDPYNAGTARLSALAFVGSPFALKPAAGSIPGDRLYKWGHPGSFGHVGIRIYGNRVAENSTVHWMEHRGDARGIRSLDAFGHYDLIVRVTDEQFQRWLDSRHN